MSQLPPGDRKILPQVPLAYRTPEPYQGRPNSLGWFALRFLIGVVLGCAAIALGYALAYETRLPVLFFLPLTVLLAGAIVVVVRYRAFGYVTGILVAGPLIVVGLIVMLMIMCGRGGGI